MTTLKQFIAKHRISMSAEWADRNPNMAADDMWMAGATHWRCILKCGKRRMTVPFSQGSAIHHEPTAEDVLNCLASDAASIKNARSFEDWAAEFGYDADSRKAEKTFQTCDKQAEQLARLLGNTGAFMELLFNTERL